MTKFKINNELIKFLDDSDIEAVGFRALGEHEIDKKELGPSWLSRDDEDEEDWRELSGTSVVLIDGDWGYLNDDDKKEALEIAYNRVQDYDIKNGIAIVGGGIDIDEVANDPDEAIFIDAEVIGHMED